MACLDNIVLNRERTNAAQRIGGKKESEIYHSAGEAGTSWRPPA